MSDLTEEKKQQYINNYAKLKFKIIETAQDLEAEAMSHTDVASWLLELADDIKTWDVDE